MSTTDMQQPHNIDAERALLGSILIDEDAYHLVSDIVNDRDFYRTDHAAVYRAASELVKANTAVDYLTVNAKLQGVTPPKEGWDVFLLELTNYVPTSINAPDYARIVADTAVRRRLINAAGKIAKVAYDETGNLQEQLAQAETELFNARGNHDRRTVARPAEYVSSYIDYINGLREDGVSPGMPTGLIDLDRLLSGLQRPHQYVVAGRPGMGKSVLALNIARHASLKLGKRVLFFALEMSQTQIVNRLVADLTHISLTKVQAPWELSDDEMERVYRALAVIEQEGPLIDDNSDLTVSDIRARCMREYSEGGLDLVIVDHMHLIKPTRSLNNSHLEIGEISAALASLYKALNVAGITVAQLSRSVESRANKRPILSDLRESGRIEENAYAVLFVYRDEYYNAATERPNVVEVNVAKHRDGPTGEVDLFWNGPQVRISNLQRQQVDLPTAGIYTNGRHPAPVHL